MWLSITMNYISLKHFIFTEIIKNNYIYTISNYTINKIDLSVIWSKWEMGDLKQYIPLI